MPRRRRSQVGVDGESSSGEDNCKFGGICRTSLSPYGCVCPIFAGNRTVVVGSIKFLHLVRAGVLVRGACGKGMGLSPHCSPPLPSLLFLHTILGSDREQTVPELFLSLFSLSPGHTTTVNQVLLRGATAKAHCAFSSTINTPSR